MLYPRLKLSNIEAEGVGGCARQGGLFVRNADISCLFPDITSGEKKRIDIITNSFSCFMVPCLSAFHGIQIFLELPKTPFPYLMSIIPFLFLQKIHLPTYAVCDTTFMIPTAVCLGTRCQPNGLIIIIVIIIIIQRKHAH